MSVQAETSKRKRGQRWSVLVRLTMTAVLLYLIGRSIDWEKISQLFREINYWWLAAASVVMIIVRFLMAVRWRFVLESEGIKKPLRDLVKIIFVSQFIGHLLPGSVGIEAVRGYEIAKDHGKITSVTTTLILDRVIGTYAMLFMALIGVIWGNLSGSASYIAVWPVLIITLVAVAGWAIMFPIAPKIIGWRLFEGGPLEKPWSKVMLILASVTSASKLKQILGPMFIVSFFVQTIRCVIFYCLYYALGATTAFSNFMVFIPLMFLAVLLPVSIGGLGVREGTLAYFFATVGIATEVSVGVGILSHFLQILLSLPLMMLWVFERRSEKRTREEAVSVPLINENTAV